MNEHSLDCHADSVGEKQLLITENRELGAILELLHDIQVKQANIEKELVQINAKLDAVQQSSAHMDSHIELIDGVYHQVKDPFFAVMDYAGSLCNTKAIKDQTDET